MIDNPDKFTERNKIWLQEMELSAYTDVKIIIPYWLVGYDLDESHGIYGIYIDWKEESSEIVAQLNEIINEKKYPIDLSQIEFKEDFTDEVLKMIDNYMSKRNYRLVCWDTDSDSYHLFIILSAYYDELKKLGRSLNINFFTNYVS